ncbi:TetR/AcrR family transcriptional regulator [Paramicrobacterium chengjingii]|uniref:TetR/AcrR family transcriptional regulator n=1 Tax=Paramicrobacterium chengjingii TaxID=2769067 RepID=A0ABX6YKK0_9MICO|nr:TetR/AcrR family transcriptional regulator [Microbacterium chengjingii]QPZ39338.1 TetR/AcrR family transcriptional regulator [Microbacterium chengjingii]
MAGRPRTFEKDEVLRIAMRAFWERGYDGVSVAHVCAEAGIAAPSLYAAFGDKEALFDKACALYTEHLDEDLERDLSAPRAQEAIQQLLRSSAEHFTTPGQPPGCLIMGEPRLAKRREKTRIRIRARLRQAAAEGELASIAEADEVAAFIDTVLSGMAAGARDGADRDQLLAAARYAARAWPV